MADVVESTVISGVFVVTPEVHRDERGLFVETYRREWVPGAREMVQGNRADRCAGSIVGLHFHCHQADYWYVTVGSARVVLHDLREGSPTDGATAVFDLGQRPDDSHDHRGVFIPAGVAHGFAAVTDTTINYLVDAYYDPADELGIRWCDPAVDADWRVTDPVLSGRDQELPGRNEVDPRPPFED